MRRRTYSAPTPFGPYILCALIDARSTLSSLTLNGTLPTACTASVWNRTPFSFAIAPISAIGWMTPISLLAAMMRDEDRLVGDRGAQLVEADAAVLLHRQIGDAVAVLLEALARVDHRLVLGDAR